MPELVLYDQGSKYVHKVFVPPMNRPDLVIWKGRYFVWHVLEGKYKEATVWKATE